MAVKWLLPAGVAGASVFVMMAIMHVGTYLYVHEMMQKEELYIVRGDGKPTDPVHMSAGVYPGDLSFGSLHDPLEDWLGFRPTNIHMLDLIASLFPICFALLAFYLDELIPWTKMMICHSFLALGKGFFAVMTVIPDSSGWKNCQSRLKEDGVAWFRAEHSVSDILAKELDFLVGGTHYRWCADMMWSGHTFTTTLYALGLYELVRIWAKPWPKWRQYVVEALVVSITVGQQSVEIYFVILNRFHYTSDVAMAILLTLLFFTNGSISIVAKSWRNLGASEAVWGTKAALTPSTATSVRKQLEVLREETGIDDLVVMRASDVKSMGDVLVPPCCVPFCCFRGRHHILSDNDIRNLEMGLIHSKACHEGLVSSIEDSMYMDRQAELSPLSPLMKPRSPRMKA